jgi:hypothetical protein
MAASTNPDNLPYPTDGDVPDIPKDMQSLAQAVQSALTAKENSITANSTALGEKILYGPVGSVPGTLQPGQLYAGY